MCPSEVGDNGNADDIIEECEMTGLLHHDDEGDDEDDDDGHIGKEEGGVYHGKQG